MQLASSELEELPSSTRAPVKNPPRLDDTETIILVAAANRADRIVLPVPDNITASQSKVESKLRRLIQAPPLRRPGGDGVGQMAEMV